MANYTSNYYNFDLNFFNNHKDLHVQQISPSLEVNGKYYTWSKFVVFFSQDIYFFTYMFVPQEIYLEEMNRAETRYIILVVVFMLFGIVATTGLLSRVTERMEILAEKMANDPFGEETVKFVVKNSGKVMHEMVIGT